jgi:hypothetical protein
VPKKTFRPPRSLVKEWPEIFSDMYINTMPVEYLLSIRLEFHDGRIWEIAVDEQRNTTTAQTIANKLIETLHEYKEDVRQVDFKVDVDKLKKDIKKKTKNLL